VPHKDPQEKMSARLLSLAHVVFLRSTQAVTGTKAHDPLVDTLRTIRNRNNQRIPLHDSLRYVARRFLNYANAQENNAAALASSTNQVSFVIEAAERYRKANEHTRCDKDHSLLGAVKITDATPIGRGKTKHPKHRTAKHDAFDERAKNCPGKPVWLHHKKFDKHKNHVGYKFRRGICDLCKQPEVMQFCVLCKRTERKLTQLLNDDKEKDRIKDLVPEFKSLGKNDRPAMICEIGEMGGKTYYTSRSCFHYCHPTYLQGVFDRTTQDEYDDQMEAVANSTISSPYNDAE
jgi:hypothetical protein